jgi:hypothetical protein
LNPASTPESEVKEYPTPEIDVKEHPNFRTIDVGGIYGTQMFMHFEVNIYSKHLDATKGLASGQTNIPAKVSRTLECRLIIDPFHAKLIGQWLMAQVSAFEKQYAHIPSVEELQQKTANAEAEDKAKNPAIG